MKGLILLPITLCVFFCFCTKAQSVVKIPQDATTLSAAVQLAQSGDTILLAQGIYTDSVHISSKSLIFKGDPNGGSVLSPGANEKSFVLHGANIEFIFLEFDDFQQNTPRPNIAISSNYSNVKIDQCRFNNLYSPVSLYWGNFEISNSIFSGTRGSGVIHQNGGTFLMYNNLIYGGIDKTGIVINRAHGEFFNNTLVGSSPTQFRGLIINSDSISHIYNNIINGFGIGIHLNASDSIEFAALRIYNNNIYSVITPYWYEYNENLSLPIYSGFLNPNPGTGEISSPANFIDSTGGDFKIQPGSPCIDAGINAYPFSVGFDLGGSNRIIGTNPDIGAYEYSVVTAIENRGYTEENKVIKIYPQPTRDHVWISFKDSYFGTLEVLDISGKVLRRKLINDAVMFKVDLPEQSGLYFLRMINKDGIEIRQVLKQD
ncbi:MAG: T9SS type A sorting domain-containing protein [Vicingaceae bacterium]